LLGGNAFPIETIDLVKGLAWLIEEQHEPQAIGHIGLAGEITRGFGIDDTPMPRTKPKRVTAPDKIKSCIK
jgi:hypothetical protein